MDSLYFLIPIAIIFVTIAVKVFFWAVNNGQYDDLDTEGRRILFDDDDPRPSAGTAKPAVSEKVEDRQTPENKNPETGEEDR
ncbi:Cytochrome oxidase maturation protein cbb3-type [Microbulbifer aggregans]|uniref:Cytochrome oxidase maturation protein cbb3-type n=1 Tax=Microbulbifer aggregans TaxID=1769779 RepID=A0A1C9W883_9GAMM|nr:cbb3-type cytochrome oxidase assembly protein CcoS [Microbulbifer aggregans]AOS97348.1 Cytochrome oxidase maturation protein cbb3-type [Microbulbifer aggregans]